MRSAALIGLAAALALAAGASAAAPSAASRSAAGAVLSRCNWDHPGYQPFMGDLVAAVDRYTDIPAATRKRLQERMSARRYDDLVDIRRDSIAGRNSYDPAIRDMHFGDGLMCREVTRSRWTDTALERGLVYCEDGHCLLVPTVCRNLSRIERRPPTIAAAPADELLFDPPGAGKLPPEGLALLDPPSMDLPSFERLAGLVPGAGPGTPGFDGYLGGPPPLEPTLGGGELFPGGTPTLNDPGGGRGPWGGDPFTRPPFPVPSPPTVVVVLPPDGLVGAVPEPATTLLFPLGLAALFFWQRRRHADRTQGGSGRPS